MCLETFNVSRTSSRMPVPFFDDEHQRQIGMKNLRLAVQRSQRADELQNALDQAMAEQQEMMRAGELIIVRCYTVISVSGTESSAVLSCSCVSESGLPEATSQATDILWTLRVP